MQDYQIYVTSQDKLLATFSVSGMIDIYPRGVYMKGDSMETTIKIEKTTCISCINRIESRLKILGISKFDYNFQNKSATILYDEKDITVGEMVRAIVDLGYEAIVRP
jgi:copper chaperone CopZ